MPRGDFTGPWGRGPMTGRGAGYCAGYPGPGFVHGGGLRRGRGYGYGPGFGGGRGFGGGYPTWGGPALGWGQGYYAPQEADWQSEAAMLTDVAGALESQLKDIKKRLADIEKEERKD